MHAVTDFSVVTSLTFSQKYEEVFKLSKEECFRAFIQYKNKNIQTKMFENRVQQIHKSSYDVVG